MRRDRSSTGADDDDFDDFDWDNQADGDRNDAADDFTETERCPHCGADIYEDAVQCPACGQYITFDTNVWSGRPWWWMLIGILGTAALIISLLLIF